VASVRRVHVVVRRSLSQAKRWGWVSENVAADASPGRVPRREIAPPDPEVTMRLIEQAEAEDPDFGAFLRLAATTGARRGELCALRWRDVDLAEGRLAISRALVDCADGGYVEKDTKAHAARRIALDASMVKSLRAHKQRQAERALMGGVRSDGQTRVFSYEPDGSVQWRPDGVTARFVRLRDGLGFTGVRCTTSATSSLPGCWPSECRSPRSPAGLATRTRRRP
jgi:integrase